MKIDCVNYYNYAVFAVKRHNVTFGDCKDWFADEEPSYQGVSDRHYIRNRIYQEMYGANIREKIENDRKKPITNLGDAEDIDNFYRLGNMSYSGASLVNFPDYFKLLGSAGVERIIDLVNNPNLKKYCEKYGLDYCVFDLYLRDGNHSIFQDKKDLIAAKRDELAKEGLQEKGIDIAIENYINSVDIENTQYIYELKKLIDIVNKGRFYMSCDYGCRTMNCMSMVTLFNPDWIGEKLTPTKEFVDKIKNMYNNLTNEHKQILGMSDGDCLNLKRQILKLANK